MVFARKHIYNTDRTCNLNFWPKQIVGDALESRYVCVCVLIRCTPYLLSEWLKYCLMQLSVVLALCACSRSLSLTLFLSPSLCLSVVCIQPTEENAFVKLVLFLCISMMSCSLSSLTLASSSTFNVNAISQISFASPTHTHTH